MPTDEERIEFIEWGTKQSQTGASIEWTQEEGYRFMTFHKVDRGQNTIRDAIDAAMVLRKWR